MPATKRSARALPSIRFVSIMTATLLTQTDLFS